LVLYNETVQDQPSFGVGGGNREISSRDQRRENFAKGRVLPSRNDINRCPRRGERCSRRGRMREAGRGTLLPPHSDDVGAPSAWQMRPFTPAGSGLDPPRERPVVRIRFPPAASPLRTTARP